MSATAEATPRIPHGRQPIFDPSGGWWWAGPIGSGRWEDGVGPFPEFVCLNPLAYTEAERAQIIRAIAANPPWFMRPCESPQSSRASAALSPA